MRENQRKGFTCRERERSWEMGIQERDPKTKTEIQRITDRNPESPSVYTQPKGDRENRIPQVHQEE